MFKKALVFVKSKVFLMILLFLALFILSLFFYFFGSLLAFNEVYIFSSAYLRFGIIFILWLCIFLFFLLKPSLNFLSSLKSEKRAKMRALKKEANDFLFRAKRNYSLSLNDAKKTWKQGVKTKNLPLVIIIGNEGAGKSTFINYSNIEYPLSDSLNSYKKLHQSTKNFALYVSKSGALLDTEGNYFSQEEFFKPNSSDEMPEDDLEKNKEYIIKKNIWQNFLNFLNKSFFHSKLNGIVLVIDTMLFLNNSNEYSKNLIRYLVKRVNDCESFLNVKLPIYIIFSKLDLIEGMREFFELFNERVANKVLGLSFQGALNEEYLSKELSELSSSLLFAFMDKNKMLHSLEDKNKGYLFIKQLDNLFALTKSFILQMQEQNSLKNSSYLRGLYFVSAYQENIPRNFLLDAICDKYNIKKALAKSKSSFNKQSYFVKSLLEDIIFKDYSLSSMKTYLKKLSFFALILSLVLLVYFSSAYFITKSNDEFNKSKNTLKALNALLYQSDYKNADIIQKAGLLVSLKNILDEYPKLWQEESLLDYINLDLSYKGFKKAQRLYYDLNEEVLKNTLLKEIEQSLQAQTNKEGLIKSLYIYKSLFKEEYFSKELLGVWINENWDKLSKYGISKDNFLYGINELKKLVSDDFKEDEKIINEAILKLNALSKEQRVFVVLDFLNAKSKQVYNIKEELGFNTALVFSPSSKLNISDKSYTKLGLVQFLATLNAKVEQAINAEAWLMKSLVKEDKQNIAMGVLKLYLNAYEKAWQEMLFSLTPMRYNNKQEFFNELDILISKESPINKLISIISTNTKLDDPLLLAQAYTLGLNAAELRNAFTNLSKNFNAYHHLNELLAIKDKEASDKSLENISISLEALKEKINDFTTNTTQSTEDKISYVLADTKQSSDVFSVFALNTKKLPSDLQRYYNELSLYAWYFIENYGISLFNSAWQSEVYTPFINNIAPFYPFNKQSIDDISMDDFKGFFGANGTLNSFYKKYLNKLLIKRKTSYTLNTKFSSKLSFSKEFLDFLSKANALSGLMLNANDNVKINFSLQSLDLSADFSFIELSYENKMMKYDHTLNQSLQIIAQEFNNGTSFNIKAYNYANSSLNYTKLYKGEWGWYKLIKDSVKNKDYTFLFNNDKKLYFDFKIINGSNELDKLVALLDNFKITQNIGE